MILLKSASNEVVWILALVCVKIEKCWENVDGFGKSLVGLFLESESLHGIWGF